MSANGSVLFASNCFGEDRSAALIARELKRIFSKNNRRVGIFGASLISEGRDYSSRGIPLLYSSRVPPSGGFPTRSLRGLVSDIIDGGFNNTLRFIEAIRDRSAAIRLAVVVGDVPLLWLVRRALKKTPVIFLAPAKSDYIQPHYRIEEFYIRRACDAILTHDQFTADRLARKGLNAAFLGNPMVDGLEPAPGRRLKTKPGRKTVGILPGSRDEAYGNFRLILDVLPAIAREHGKPCNWIAALPSTLTDGSLRERTAVNGWSLKRSGHKLFLSRDGLDVLLTRDCFPEVLAASDILIGLAGTAVEQAASLGKPVISFCGTGPQTTRRRMEEQERLLGGAMKFVRDYPDGAVREAVFLLSSPTERKRRGQIGQKRMGRAGGALRIAEYLERRYFRSVRP